MGAEARRQMARVRGLAENHVLVDPIKVTILTPGLSADGSMQEHGIPAAVVTKFLSARRIEIEKTGLYSFLVLFSMGITKGKWSTLITELLNFKDLYDANAPLKRVLPALVEAHPAAYAKMGLKDLCEQVHQVYRDDNVPKAQRDMYTTLPEMAMRPADAYDNLVRGQVESVEIDNLMGRTLGRDGGAVPARHPADHAGRAHHAGNQVDSGLSAVCARIRPKVPGLRNRYSRSAVRAHRGRKALSGGLHRVRERAMIPRDVKSPTAPIPFHKLLKVVAIVDRNDEQTKAASRSYRGREFRDRGLATTSSGTSPKMPLSAPTSRWSTAIASSAHASWRGRFATSDFKRRSGRSRIRTASPTSRPCQPPARSTATSISGSRPRLLCQAGRRQPPEVRKDPACRPSSAA